MNAARYALAAIGIGMASYLATNDSGVTSDVTIVGLLIGSSLFVDPRLPLAGAVTIAAMRATQQDDTITPVTQYLNYGLAFDAAVLLTMALT